jgi:hypothetical protein
MYVYKLMSPEQNIRMVTKMFCLKHQTRMTAAKELLSMIRAQAYAVGHTDIKQTKVIT